MSLWVNQFMNSSERGEWAEMRFLGRASEQRFRVSKPWGNTSPYDLMVEKEGAIYRVQVKSTTAKVSAKGYNCGMPTGKRLQNILKEIDFVAAYVIPLDLWYIIPAGVVRVRKGKISLHPWCRRSKYERYLEAWYLLRKWREGEKSAGALKRARSRAARERRGGRPGPIGRPKEVRVG